jgi:hypothetical protein
MGHLLSFLPLFEHRNRAILACDWSITNESSATKRHRSLGRFDHECRGAWYGATQPVGGTRRYWQGYRTVLKLAPCSILQSASAASPRRDLDSWRVANRHIHGTAPMRSLMLISGRRHTGRATAASLRREAAGTILR